MNTNLSQSPLGNNSNADCQILFRLKERDITAFIALYDKYSPALYGTILKMVDNEKIATKILQKAFVKIWEECATKDYTKSGVFIWMYSVAYKLAKAEVSNVDYKPLSSKELIA